MIDYDNLARHLGYLDAGIDAPVFLIPVFRDLDNDELLIQVSDSKYKISRFQKVPSNTQFIQSSSQGLRKNGDDIIFGLLKKNIQFPIYADIESFKEVLEDALLKGEFDEVPAFAVTVAKFVDNLFQIDRFNQQVFDETPDTMTKTKKFYLENNIVRETLYRKMPTDRHLLISQMVINIDKQRIKLKLPENTSQLDRKNLGKEVAEIYKNFTKSSAVELSFQEQYSDMEYFVQEIELMRKGRLYYGDNIFDLPLSQEKFAIRDAVILIPEAANQHFSSRNTVIQSIFLMTSKKFGPSTISEGTARRIVELKPVSLVSAMLFRVWLFADIQMARHSSSYLLHVCRFRVKAEYAKQFTDILFSQKVLIRNEVALFLAPISFITFLISLKIINQKRAVSMFESRRFGTAIANHLTLKFRISWAKYCIETFPSSGRVSAIEIINQTKY